MGQWFKSADYRASQIVRGLYDRGVDLFVEDGELHYKGVPSGIVTEDDLVDIDNYYYEIIALILKPNNVIPFPAPHDGREKKSPRKGVLDYWNAAMADFEAPGDEAG